MPEIAGGSAPMGAIGELLSGGGPPGANADAMRAQLEATMQQIRDIGAQVQSLAASNPMLAEDAAQISQLLKQMVVKSAQVAPSQTASGMAVPGGGMTA